MKIIPKVALLLIGLLILVAAFFLLPNNVTIIWEMAMNNHEVAIKKQNALINSTSNELKASLPNLPKDITDNIVLMGTPTAKTVLVYAQGGPTMS